MSPELEEFRQQILAHAKLVASRAPKVTSEAGTNSSLVQPFLMTLGYDAGNPEDVSPEHHADYAERFQNRVDYAILRKGAPVIALESKRFGAGIKNCSGQLRSYFHACQTVKLGILTDGMKYEFYADSDKQNVMDDNAFLRLDFAEIAKNETIDDHTLSSLAVIRKGFFNPENVGAEAKLKILFEEIIAALKTFKSEPSDDFIRFMLRQSEIGSKIGHVTQKVVDMNRDVVRSAMDAFVAQEALARLGFAPKDVVRTLPDSALIEQSAALPSTVIPEPELSPSTGEMNAFNYARNRLFYLVRHDILFQEVQKITFKKTRTSFRVYYEKPNNGSIFDYREQKDGKPIIQFTAPGGNEIAYGFSPELDDCLLKVFSKRVKEAGVTFDASPELRSIRGGQADNSRAS